MVRETAHQHVYAFKMHMRSDGSTYETRTCVQCGKFWEEVLLEFNHSFTPEPVTTISVSRECEQDSLKDVLAGLKTFDQHWGKYGGFGVDAQKRIAELVKVIVSQERSRLAAALDTLEGFGYNTRSLRDGSLLERGWKPPVALSNVLSNCCETMRVAIKAVDPETWREGLLPPPIPKLRHNGLRYLNGLVAMSEERQNNLRFTRIDDLHEFSEFTKEEFKLLPGAVQDYITQSSGWWEDSFGKWQRK